MLSPGTISAFQGRIQTRYTNKTLPQSIKKEDHADSFNELSGYLLQLLPNGILSGLTLSLSGSNVLIEPGTWMIDSFVYSIISQQSLPIDAQDVTDSRYDVLYADDTGNVHLISGALSLTPLEPSIPNDTIKLGSILITPTTVTITPPPLTGYVDTTTNQDVHGLKNFMDGVQTVTRPLGDSTVNAATTQWVQNELADYTILPSLTGNAGKVLGTDGTTVSWVPGGSGGGTTTHAITVNNSGSGDASGFTFDGSAAKTISYNSIGAQATLVSGTNIKTINSTSLLGSTNILLQTPLVAGTDYLAPTGSAAGLTGLLSAQVTTALGFTPENVANKATDFTTINNTLYPTTQAVFNFVELINTILTGLVTTTSGTTATTTAGTYRINNTVYTIGTSTNTTIPAQDATLSRYSILYGTTGSAISIVNGSLSLTPVEPTIPANTVLLATILITPSTVTVSGGGKKGAGTLTSVTSSTTDIAVANSTTAPVLTLTKVNGFAISFYDPTSSIQTQLNSKLTTISGIAAGGDLTGTYPNPTITNTTVTGKTLSGLSISAGTVSSSDTILAAFGKIQGTINGLANGLVYKGTWNASTNTPTITSSTGTLGWFYKVSVAGTTTIDGNSNWTVGDILLFDGSTWDKIEGNANDFVSFNGRTTGIIVLTQADVNAVNATVLGTVTTGVWQGTAIADTYISSSSNWNTAYTSRITAGVINWPGTVYTTPTNATISSNTITFAPALATQTANTIFAGPTTGSAATPTFRALVAADIPTISLTTGVSGTLQAAQFPALTGDITTSAGSLATTLKNTGTAGTYGQVTTDAQGRVTSGNATTPVANGGTNFSSYTTGDILYASSSSVLSKLAIGGANTVLHGGTTPAYSGVAIADLTATGTPSSTTYLRGDNTWATVSGSTNIYNTDGTLTANRTVSAGGFTLTFSPPIIFNASITAASSLARGNYTNQTLTAAANNDVLIADDINPVFTAGAFTGVATIGQRIQMGTFGVGILATPGAPSCTPTLTGGTLAAGTYYYKIVAFDVLGRTTLAGAETSTTIASGTTGKVVLTWSVVPYATGYRVYRGTSSNGQSVYYTPNNSVNGAPTYTDTNAASTAGTTPIVNGTVVSAIGTDGTINGINFGYGNNQLNNNLVVGYTAGNVITTGTSNIFIGALAGLANTTGNTNTFVGYQAGATNISNSQCVFIGHQAGRLSVADNNSAVGYQCGFAITGGTGNTFFGSSAGQAVTTGNYNTFMGNAAGYFISAGSTGNTFVGNSAGSGFTSAVNFNTGVGDNVMNQATNGANNAALGYNSGRNIQASNAACTQLDNSIMVGYQANPLANTQTNQIVIGYNVYGQGSNSTSIGNSSTTLCLLYGVLNSPVGATASKNATVGGKIKEYFTDAGNTTTTETDLYSYTTEASMLSANGASIQAEYGGIFVSSATATREVKVYFGGTVIYDSGALSVTTSSQWTVYASIIRVSGTVIRYMVSIVVDGVTLTSPCSAGELTGLTLSSTNILKITGQSASTGAATNDIVGKLGAVYYWPVSV